MGFTPPPEKLATFSATALLTTAFLTSLRGATLESGTVRFADGSRHWPVLDSLGHWGWTSTPGHLVTAATFAALMAGALQTDGSIIVGSARWWLCSVTLSDGTPLALAVPA